MNSICSGKLAKQLLRAASSIAIATLLGCGGKPSGSTAAQSFALVCDPNMGGATPSAPVAPNSGIVAQAYQLPDTDTGQYSSVLDLEANGTQIQSQIFFDQIYVPEYAHFTGFPTTTGDVVRAPGGAPLVSNFALHISGALQLPADHAEGLYQFAVLSDDGALFQLDMGNGSGPQSVINNTNSESTAVGCSADGYALTHAGSYAFTMDYYNLCQCSGDHTALTLLWRNVPALSTPADLAQDPVNAAFCGINDDNYFFDTSTPSGASPSTPLAPWTNALSGGWEVIPTDAYFLPPNVVNPCS